MEWLISKKKIINNANKIIENPLYVSDTNKILQSINAANMEKILAWSADEQA